jgi:hypothetical protein
MYCGPLTCDKTYLNVTRKLKRKWNWRLLKLITDAQINLLLVKGS